MSKPIDNYLDSVVDLYKGFIKKGEIIPLEFKFPSFNVTKGVFNLHAVEALSERVRIGVDSGSYGLQKYAPDIDYDELISYASRKKISLTTPTEDKTTGVLIEKVLVDKIKQDSSITAGEARNGALSSACVKTMDYKLQELINFDFFNQKANSPHRELRRENDVNELLMGMSERVDFVATLVSMKEVLPKIEKQVMETLAHRQELAQESVKHFSPNSNEESVNQNVQTIQLIGALKRESANPSSKVLARALEVEPTLAKNFIEKYPQAMKEVISEGNRKGLTYKM